MPAHLLHGVVLVRRRIKDSSQGGRRNRYVQLRLDVFPSSTEFVFNAEKLWKSGVLSRRQVALGFRRPFPLCNISDEKKIGELIDHIVFEGRKQLIVPTQFLALAFLNMVDNHLGRDNMSRFFKSKHFKGLSMGRRSMACRLLKDRGYIVDYGSCWYRTDKKFDERDFWPNM
jgi:hypothetical protein